MTNNTTTFKDLKGNPLYFNPSEEITNITNQIKNYFVKNGPDSKAIIGISGGKDSTIAAALLVKALGKDRVIGVLMPDGCQKDIKDSYQICDILDIKYYEIDLDPIMTRIYNTYYLEINDAVETNTLPRIRMTTLYMVAASLGGRVINTCNFSEDYVGYSTKYGDLAGDFSILKNYTVREILAIGDALNLPKDLVHKVPSDGLCGKTDEDNLGFSYETLDAFLLENILPDYPIYKEIMNRHNRNKHKECIKIPAVQTNRKFMFPGYGNFENYNF